MKKLCLVMALVFLMVNAAVFSEGTPKIAVSDANANAGETAKVTISLENNPGIISMLLSVEYDSDALKLDGVEDAGILGTSVHSPDFSRNPYTLLWSNGTASENFTVNGTIVTLTFAVNKNAKSGSYPIKVTYDKEDGGIIDFDLNSVEFGTSNGKITVKGTDNDTQNNTVGQSVTVTGGGGGGGASSDGGSTAAEGDKKSDLDKQDTQIARAPGEVAVTLNGKVLVFPDQKPVIQSDRTLVPLRAIFEALGAEVDWDDEAKKVTSTKGDITISLIIGSDILYVNGAEVIIDVPAQIMNDRTMVPLRAIAESFKCNVDWDGETKTVIITE